MPKYIVLFLIFLLPIFGQSNKHTDINTNYVFHGYADFSSSSWIKIPQVLVDPSGICTQNNVLVISLQTNKIFVCNNGTWQTANTAGTGTLTNFQIDDLNPIFTSQVINSTTIPHVSFTLQSWNANTFLAAPDGTNGIPTNRTLVPSDVSHTNLLTYNSNISIDITNQPIAIEKILLTGNINTLNIIGSRPGQILYLQACQDQIGGHHINFPSSILGGFDTSLIQPNKCGTQMYTSLDGTNFYAANVGIINQ